MLWACCVNPLELFPSGSVQLHSTQHLSPNSYTVSEIVRLSSALGRVYAFLWKTSISCAHRGSKVECCIQDKVNVLGKLSHGGQHDVTLFRKSL